MNIEKWWEMVDENWDLILKLANRNGGIDLRKGAWYDEEFYPETIKGYMNWAKSARKFDIILEFLEVVDLCQPPLCLALFTDGRELLGWLVMEGRGIWEKNEEENNERT